jgi:hypothetical protein
MHGNKQAYQAAYERALAGKSTRSLLDMLTWPFEDNYSRQSREEGARDGAAARLAQTQGAAQASSAPPAQH